MGETQESQEYKLINNKEDFRYYNKEILGEGRGTYVFLGEIKEEKTWKEVAVKRIQLADADLIELGQREIENLRQLQQHEPQNEHIVKFLRFEDHDEFRYIAFERCKTDLRKYVSSPEYDQVLTDESYKIRVILQLAEALKFIHSRKIIHRDIKPANILVSSNGSPVIMKWADFGHSKQIDDSGCALMSGTRGTQNWLAPEIIPFFYKEESLEESEACSSIKSDIFSAGCVFFFFLTKGVHPYGEVTEDDSDNLKNNIINGTMQNSDRLDNGHRAKLTVLQMMENQVENRLGLELVITQFNSALSTP